MSLSDGQCEHAHFAAGAEMDSELGICGNRNGSEQEPPQGDMAKRGDSLHFEHKRPLGASCKSDTGGTSSSEDSGDHDAASGDHDVAMGNVLGSALTYQLRQPQIYKALGMDKPLSSIPAFEADQWLESWQVIASSVPSQQAKLSESAP